MTSAMSGHRACLGFRRCGAGRSVPSWFACRSTADSCSALPSRVPLRRSGPRLPPTSGRRPCRCAEAEVAGHPRVLAAGSGTEVAGSASGHGWLGFNAGDGSRARRSSAVFVLSGAGCRSPRPCWRRPAALRSSSARSSSTTCRRASWGVSLTAAGSVGRSNAVPGDPERIPPQQYRPVVNDGIQVGDRSVWVLTGSRGTGLEALWACCSSTGELSVLSRFINRQRGMRFLQLGRDGQGRLWLAWLDVIPRGGLGRGKDGRARPEHAFPAHHQRVRRSAPESWLQPQIVCAAACRVVMGDLGGDIFTWAPGERSPARMHLGTRPLPATLLDASFRSGNLVVASSRTVRLRRAPWSLDQIKCCPRRCARLARSSRRLFAPAPFRPTSPSSGNRAIRELRARRPRLLQEVLQLRAGNQTRVLAGFLLSFGSSRDSAASDAPCAVEPTSVA